MLCEGRCAFVTGAGSGLGRATAERLHAAGAHVALADLDADRLAAVAGTFADRVIACPVDVRDPDQIDRALASAEQRFGALHIAVSCAGIASSAKTIASGQPHDRELWRRVIEVNLSGTFWVTSLAAARMSHNTPDERTGERGVIINTASIAAFDGQRGQAAYAASKAGVAGFTLPVARDLADQAIRCVAIAPGLFDTALLEGIGPKGMQALRRSLLFPERPGQPEEFAALVKHVIENPYINAACLRLDGGARL